MNILIFLIGIAIPVLLGWISLLLLERSHPVLGQIERWFWALILGPTFFSLIVFISHAVGLTQLNFPGFLMPTLIVLVLLIVLAKRSGAFAIRNTQIAYAGRILLPSPLKIAILILSIWTLIKLLAGAYDLVSVPTYWDDSFNNWNMRGKMFFVHEKLLLEIPIGNGLIQGSSSVSSYPPTVPLLKTWLSVLRGSWEEPLVNGLHLIWLAGLIGSFTFALRRHLSPLLSLGGTYLLVSLPLFLIQGTNPYADIFLAAHVFLAVLCVYSLARAKEFGESKTWLKLAGFTFGLLLFTKNEAIVLYVPLLTILLAWILTVKVKNGALSAKQVRTLIGLGLLIGVPIAAPWLLFKWFHGLSFGNAKSISGMTIAADPRVLHAIWFHLSHEPNWLFLPLVLPLSLICAGKEILRRPEGVLAVFVVTTICVQFLIFLFVSSLATEAIMQTGLSRGLLHVAPVAVLLVILLVERLLSRPLP